jgi:hypothetical protein
MEILGAIAIIIVVIIALGLVVGFYYLRKGYKFVKRMTRGEMTEEDFERLSNRFYKKKDKVNFDSDYFKGSGTQQQGRQQQQGPFRRQQQQSTRTTIHTADGVTIVDERQPQSNKKIFAQDEGEYVEFTEE